MLKKVMMTYIDKDHYNKAVKGINKDIDELKKSERKIANKVAETSKKLKEVVDYLNNKVDIKTFKKLEEKCKTFSTLADLKDLYNKIVP